MRLLAASLVLFACVFAPACLAQDVYNEINVGTPPNGLFHGGEIDTVQLNNGNLHIEIPLWTVQGRGPLAPGAIFALDTKQWAAKITYNKNTNTTTATIRTELNGTFGGITSGITALSLSSTGHVAVPGCTAYTSNYVIRESNGTKHHMIPDPGDGCPAIKSWSVYYADDASGLVYKPASGILRKNVNSSGIDTNGNQLSTTDTLGRSLADGSLTYYDSSGNPQTIQITRIGVPVSTHLCQFVEGVDQCFEFSGTKNEVSQIRLANGMTYTINYVQNDEGEPSSIILPSGAQISWTYNTGDKGGPTVATRTVTANGPSNT